MAEGPVEEAAVQSFPLQKRMQQVASLRQSCVPFTSQLFLCPSVCSQDSPRVLAGLSQGFTKVASIVLIVLLFLPLLFEHFQVLTS